MSLVNVVNVWLKLNYTNIILFNCFAYHSYFVVYSVTNVILVCLTNLLFKRFPKSNLHYLHAPPC